MIKRCRIPAWVAVSLLVLSSPSEAGSTTWVVDAAGGPGSDFTAVQPALDVAVAGDAIEVRSGTYAGFVVSRGVAVYAAAGASVDVTGGVVVQNLAAGEPAELSRLNVHPAGEEVALELLNVAGAVRIEDCTLEGYDALPPSESDGLPALSADTCDEVVLVRCTLIGGDGYVNTTLPGYFGGFSGGEGILAFASSVEVYDSNVSAGQTGGFFVGESCLGGPMGSHGARATQSSTLFAANSTFTGGPGGAGGCDPGLFTCCSSGSRGGDATHFDASSSGSYHAVTFSPGLGGIGGYVFKGCGGEPGCFDGASGSERGGLGGSSVTEIPLRRYCFGERSACPCANAGAGTAGCEGAFDTGGARLDALGTASVGSDSITLVATGLNPSTTPTGLFFQGSLAQNGGLGTVLNDGLLCAGGTIVRLKGKTAIGGTTSLGFGVSGDPELSILGQLPPAGGTRFYQFWYRHQPAMFCPPERFNMSNGVEIVWGP